MKNLFLLDRHSSLFTKRERILYFILFIFFLSLYMPVITWLYNVLMYVIFVYSFFYNTLSEKWALLKKRTEILLIIFFFLLNCVSALLSDNVKVGISFVGLRISLFVLPVALGSLYIRKELKDRLIFAFGFATLIAAIGCICFSIFKAITSKDSSLLYNDNLTYIINLQSIYFAMFVNLALFSFAYLLLTKSELLNYKLTLSIIVFLLIVHFLLASRIAIIILYAGILVIAAYYIFKEKRYMLGIVIVLFMAAGSLSLIKFFPQTINRFKELEYTKFDYKSTAKDSHFTGQLTADQWNGANTRIAVWNCAWIVIEKHFFLGTQIGDKKEALKQVYISKDFKEGLNKNTHNNYLDVWLSLGLVGLILFLSGFFIFPIYYSIAARDWYGVIIIIAFAISLITETYIDRTMGNTMLAFFLSFISCYKNPSVFKRNPFVI